MALCTPGISQVNRPSRVEHCNDRREDDWESDPMTPLSKLKLIELANGTTEPTAKAPQEECRMSRLILGSTGDEQTRSLTA